MDVLQIPHTGTTCKQRFDIGIIVIQDIDLCIGGSMINDRPVVYMSAQIPEAGNASTSITVQDRDLYETNKTECRKDIEAFNQLVYAAEDERVTGGTADETEK